VRKLATAESLAGLTGIALVALGVLGFVPGTVQSYGELAWWKSGSRAELFDVFQTSILLNLVHIGLGVAGLVAARRWTTARLYLAIGGAATFGLGIYGLLVSYRSGWNFLSLDRADEWLHIGLGIGMLYAGLGVGLGALRPATST
jgi:Domain of unknown function (DUF4383)